MFVLYYVASQSRISTVLRLNHLCCERRRSFRQSSPGSILLATARDSLFQQRLSGSPCFWHVLHADLDKDDITLLTCLCIDATQIRAEASTGNRHLCSQPVEMRLKGRPAAMMTMCSSVVQRKTASQVSQRWSLREPDLESMITRPPKPIISRLSDFLEQCRLLQTDKDQFTWSTRRRVGSLLLYSIASDGRV